MKSIGKFLNLVILDILCGELIPPLSSLPKLRELVLFTSRSQTQKWYSLVSKEIPKSVRFLSVDLITSDVAEILLEHVQLTVLRVTLSREDYRGFEQSFLTRRENPKLFVGKAGASYLWTGETSFVAVKSLFQRRYLTYA
jgi:hypothetical protein